MKGNFRCFCLCYQEIKIFWSYLLAGNVSWLPLPERETGKAGISLVQQGKGIKIVIANCQPTAATATGEEAVDSFLLPRSLKLPWSLHLLNLILMLSAP